MGKVKDYIMDRLNREGALLFSVIDPLDYKTLDDAVKTAKEANEGGSDVILIGGSTGVQGPLLDEVAKRIKEEINIPVVLFPGNIATLTRYADATYFMSLLNSRNPYWITRAQMLAAPVIKRLNIEPLSVAYVVVEPGGTVGWVGDVDLIPRKKPKIAAAFALAAETMGFSFVLTDAGSNPHNGHIPLDFISYVRRAIKIPYIVAGGIRTPEQAKQIVEHGADILQIGTAFEKSGSRDKIKEFVKAIREGAKKR